MAQGDFLLPIIANQWGLQLKPLQPRHCISCVYALSPMESYPYNIQDGKTPLMWAAYEGHTEVVRVLHDLGADVNHQSKASYN